MQAGASSDACKQGLHQTQSAHPSKTAASATPGREQSTWRSSIRSAPRRPALASQPTRIIGAPSLLGAPLKPSRELSPSTKPSRSLRAGAVAGAMAGAVMGAETGAVTGAAEVGSPSAEIGSPGALAAACKSDSCAIGTRKGKSAREAVPHSPSATDSATSSELRISGNVGRDPGSLDQQRAASAAAASSAGAALSGAAPPTPTPNDERCAGRRPSAVIAAVSKS